MSPKFTLPLLFVANLLIPVALLIFATGFFPYKPFIPGRALAEDLEYGNTHEPAPFDKVIFMVVDALRSDFVYSRPSGFNFTQSLIRSGAAMPFTAHATSPTITMPRIKAMTTGSIPSFIDVILNFADSDTASSLASQDTWLSQLKAKPGGKLVMNGDDTWLKLFPDTFSRADGTSSFFVSDFTEVDNNVTRHISSELEKSDWNGFIMHYLGLDHIGHKSGPRSPNMIPKQTEMDGIVQQIYESIQSEKQLQSTLLVLCGDHGMNDAGNHGGSAEGETSPALIFVSPKLQSISQGAECPVSVPDSGFDYYSKIEQSDIVPTLAGLLGFAVPLNNLGVIVPELLQFWTEDTRLGLMLQNARQILDIVRGTFPAESFDGGDNINCTLRQYEWQSLGCMWTTTINAVNSPETSKTKESLILLQKFCKRAQEVMSSTASNYDISRLNLGIGVATVAVIAVLEIVFERLIEAKTTGLWTSLVTIVYGIMMFASSYVEEEQQFWYWAASAWLAWLLLKQCTTETSSVTCRAWSAFSLLVILRVVRIWNQTGQKHAGEPDIARTLFPTHNFILWSLVLGTYLDVVQRLSRSALSWASRQLSTAAALALGIAALGFKISFTKADAPELLNGLEWLVLRPMGEASLVAQARAVFLSIAIFFLLTSFPVFNQNITQRGSIRALAKPYHDLLTLFLITQSRATNIPLFLLFQLQYLVLDRLSLTNPELTLTSLLFQHVSFFASGGSNAISSVDLSNAYNGIDDYNVVAVGILTFCGNWAGPLWWTSATMLLLSNREIQGRRGDLVQHLSLLTTFASSSVLFVMLACTALRTHLFIWTVFSPKYLYSIAWSVGQHLCVNIGYGGLMYHVATS